MLMRISLSLKTDIAIRLVPFAIAKKKPEKLEHVHQKEKHKQPLYLLTEMNALVTNICISYPHILSEKHKSTKRNTIIGFCGKMLGTYDDGKSQNINAILS